MHRLFNYSFRLLVIYWHTYKYRAKESVVISISVYYFYRKIHTCDLFHFYLYYYSQEVLFIVCNRFGFWFLLFLCLTFFTLLFFLICALLILFWSSEFVAKGLSSTIFKYRCFSFCLWRIIKLYKRLLCWTLCFVELSAFWYMAWFFPIAFFIYTFLILLEQPLYNTES